MNIVDEFINCYGEKPTVVSKAPGRLEILGNHTDYNEGVVLSAAVDQATEFALLPVDGDVCVMSDFRDGSRCEFNLNDIDEPIPGDWSNYIKGVICELRKLNIAVGAFKGAIRSTIPLSAGMSSSAALEMSAAFAFSNAFSIDLPKAQWARIGQAVENKYMGLQSGLLDQFSSLFGEKDSVIFCDFRSVEVKRTVKIHKGYVLVVVNSMIKHNLVDSDYNQRRESCDGAVKSLQRKYPDITALRDVSYEMLVDAKELLDHTDYKRALHVVGENSRVIQGIEALEQDDMTRFGELLYQSHLSSIDNFENSCSELDYLVELSRSIPGCIGARLSGGGFGGISIHLVEEASADEYCERIKAAYKLKTGIETETIICSFGEGATILQ